MAVTPSRRLTLFPAAAVDAVAAGRVAGAPAGVTGADSSANVLSRSSLAITTFASTASSGFSFTESAPEPLLSPSAILKSLAAKSAWEASIRPSKLNLLENSRGNGGAGWPARLTSVVTKFVSDSADTVAMPPTRAFGPSSLSVPLKPSLPLASSETLVA